ncbi:unnamed protein product [Caenorhabditis sp. 36 PRJEB53466]|nr:unnamed protein product [Caenorhabditis sp. 36 PRJEB53466]
MFRKDMQTPNMTYKLMNLVNVFDLGQGFGHFVTAPVLVFPRLHEKLDFFVRGIGCMMNTFWVADLPVMAVLAVCRIMIFCKMIHPENFHRAIKVILFLILTWFSFVLAYGCAAQNMKLTPPWWGYDFDVQYSEIFDMLEIVLSFPSLVTSYIAYLTIIYLIYVKKKGVGSSQSRKDEMAILLQYTFVTIYITVLIVVWHPSLFIFFSFIDMTNMRNQAILNSLWILHCYVNPVMMLIHSEGLHATFEASKIKYCSNSVSTCRRFYLYCQSFIVLLTILGVHFLFRLKPEHNSKVLNATCGPIRGNIYRHTENKIVDGYLGIPFAKPPIGELRFKKPVPAEKWAEPRDCYAYGPGCPQSGDHSDMIPEGFYEFAEDNCLTLNVFAPRWKSEEFPEGLPVIVYFYGGGFEIGFSSFLDDYSLSGGLLLKDVIVVTVNYRVGPLGFLTTGDSVARGNYGLWDQTLGLQWVRQHIGSFGGDAHNVSIFGTSAGGASVDLLALSPHSNKLFRRFITMSGTAFCDFACRPQLLQAQIFTEFAQHHGYNGNDSQSLLAWYQSQPDSKFRQWNGFQRPASGFLSFVPNLDGDFLPKPFDDLRKEAPKFDVMAMIGEYEGLLWGCFESSNITENFEKAIETAYGPDITANYTEVRKLLFDFYTKRIDKNDEKVMEKRVVEFIGDSWFNVGTLDTIKSCARYGNNAYLASFDYYNMDARDPMGEKAPFRASSHGSELKYTLGEGEMFKLSPDDEEFKVMNMMGDFVTNFAKYGNPNGKSESGAQVWEKYNLDKPNRYFKIDYPKSEMRDNYQNGRMDVYEQINRQSNKYQEIVYGKREL